MTRDIDALQRSETPADLNQLIMAVLQAIHKGGGFDRAIFCLVNPDRTHIQGRVGLGDQAESLLATFKFPLSAAGGAVAVSLMKRQELLVDVMRDPQYSGSYFATALGAKAFGLFPIVVRQVLVGCLYFDRVQETDDFDLRARPLFARLRDCVASAIETHRG